mmetsp:Transcript_9661/g.12048  ORF Transcript_9661/g.12048 Transcript_9661/m.12048 type:complete len:267 (-) Transcript_9661:307-1107(-)|eukprot:CAMPEP_0204822504 /NCGR_PEP_ID=MMETSP1346-20131115/693_1 /ASSEMBLY_ACC=CAM_ASM_000771 /TAXON_ID=215587 /ORGANISM="Aplanochytrium stocchinoi, Strain GSBS06" /LENGTH=266 /DNA_ID=CAMNT_0051948747 /DNA_START=121 /DNA_END=921 /DNA_ORIENTATION=-
MALRRGSKLIGVAHLEELYSATAHSINKFGQPVGQDVPDWNGTARPLADKLQGEYCSLENLNELIHGQGLFDAFNSSPGSMWTYLSFSGPFENIDSFSMNVLKPLIQSQKCKPYAILVDDEPLGIVTFLRINPEWGSIEIGNVIFSQKLQRTRASTDAIYLMADHALTHLNYRRLEWKCDSLNKPSWMAALRYGFSYEGIFRNALVYKGRSRDTAWFSITCDEWKNNGIRNGFLDWLDHTNFDENDVQKSKLKTCIIDAGERNNHD